MKLAGKELQRWFGLASPCMAEESIERSGLSSVIAVVEKPESAASKGSDTQTF